MGIGIVVREAIGLIGKNVIRVDEQGMRDIAELSGQKYESTSRITPFLNYLSNFRPGNQEDIEMRGLSKMTSREQLKKIAEWETKIAKDPNGNSELSKKLTAHREKIMNGRVFKLQQTLEDSTKTEEEKKKAVVELQKLEKQARILKAFANTTRLGATTSWAIGFDGFKNIAEFAESLPDKYEDFMRSGEVDPRALDDSVYLDDDNIERSRKMYEAQRRVDALRVDKDLAQNVELGEVGQVAQTEQTGNATSLVKRVENLQEKYTPENYKNLYTTLSNKTKSILQRFGFSSEVMESTAAPANAVAGLEGTPYAPISADQTSTVSESSPSNNTTEQAVASAPNTSREMFTTGYSPEKLNSFATVATQKGQGSISLMQDLARVDGVPDSFKNADMISLAKKIGFYDPNTNGIGNLNAESASWPPGTVMGFDSDGTMFLQLPEQYKGIRVDVAQFQDGSYNVINNYKDIYQSESRDAFSLINTDGTPVPKAPPATPAVETPAPSTPPGPTDYEPLDSKTFDPDDLTTLIETGERTDYGDFEVEQIDSTVADRTNSQMRPASAPPTNLAPRPLTPNVAPNPNDGLTYYDPTKDKGLVPKKGLFGRLMNAALGGMDMRANVNLNIGINNTQVFTGGGVGNGYNLVGDNYGHRSVAEQSLWSYRSDYPEGYDNSVPILNGNPGARVSSDGRVYGQFSNGHLVIANANTNVRVGATFII
jgi:hypothetical protein